MRRLQLLRSAFVASFIGLHLSSFAGAATDASKLSKAFEWVVDAPEAHGFSRARLDALRDDLASRNTKIFLLIRDDRIINEWYAPDSCLTEWQCNRRPYRRRSERD